MRYGSSRSLTGAKDVSPVSEKKTATCDRCSEAAVIVLKPSGRRLCGDHLAQDIRARVLVTIREQGMIRDGDRIAVALSGGKDSTALLLLLYSLLPEWNNVSLVAVTVDEGIGGYRDETIGAAERLAASLGVEHVIISFTGLFGESLDSFLKGRENQACSVCGILRRNALTKAAKKAGADRLATGHNLDDEAQSVLMNVLRGDLTRLVRESGIETGHFIPRIKPLQVISEKEIATYLMVRDAWTELPECPYTRYALRAEVRTMLYDIEYQYPGTMLNLMKSRKKLAGWIPSGKHADPIRHCALCGDSCSGEVCQACLLLSSFGR